MPGKITLVQTTKEPVQSKDIMDLIKITDRFHGPIGVPFDQQYIFDSFCIDEERTKLGIEMPLEKNPYAPLSSLVLNYGDLGSKDVKKTTPEVRKPDMTNVDMTNVSMTAYEYSMYTYKIAPKPAQLSDDKRRWVFTGGGKFALGLTTNTFIPVDQLRIRLNGTAQERKIAYAEDWMTYLACWSAMGGLIKPKIPEGFQSDLARLLPEGYTAKQAKQIFTGAHLGLRNSIGELADGSKFLGDLLQPTGIDPINDLSVFIFTRWCKVAYAACIAEPAAWSVKARFWAWPQDLNNKVTFVYVMPKDMWSRVSTAKGNKAVTNILGTATAKKIKKQKDIVEIWKAAIIGAHGAAKWQAGDPKDGKTAKELPSPKCETMTMDEVSRLNNYDILASHPQGFYDIYVSFEDLHEMMKRTYVYDQALDFPTVKKVDATLFTNVKTLLATDKLASKTRTLISKSTLAAATSWPRFETQNKVMNYSANAAAQDIWSKSVISNGSFEWLHRSAYSYGGIDNMGPDSSQVPYNLVLGTYEANTTMIRHEEYLKRFVRYMKMDDFRLFLFTTLDTKTAWGNSTRSWLIKDLIYEWEFPLFKDLNYVVRTKHSFPVLSRQIPSRFEFDMDEHFDDMWMSETDDPIKQDFRIGMLLYLAGGADTNALRWNS